MQNHEQFFENANLERRLFVQSPVPLYYQLSRILEKLIQDEAFCPGSRFPTEEAISNYFSVSRPTANKAVQILIDEGYLSRDKGLGTYVKEKPLVEFTFLTDSLSFAEQFPDGVPIRSDRIWSKTVPATRKVAKELDLEPGAPTILLRRLRFVHGRPLMVCDSQLPAERFPDIAQKKFIRDSLYATLAEIYHCPVVSSDRYCTAADVTEQEIAKLLEIDPFSSVLMIIGVSRTEKNRPIDYFRTFLSAGVVLKTTVRPVRRKETRIKDDVSR
jgi:DNA-binding GntR family transcriptional regulator